MLNLRPAVPTDAALILEYIRELAEYEREPEAAVATEADILRHAFSEQPLLKVTMAEWDGKPAGFALWFLNFSTWEGRPGIYLEDLFVRPAYRGHGWQIGSGSMESACKAVVCQRLCGTGMRWGGDGADAVCHLRALFRSEPGQWQAFWNRNIN